MENFRPITVIYNFAKALELALFQRIHNHIKDGLMKNRSTISNVFCITQFIYNTLDNHAHVDVIFRFSSVPFVATGGATGIDPRTSVLQHIY